MATHKLLLLPGDGIGTEVMAEVKRIITQLKESRKVARGLLGVQIQGVDADLAEA